MSGFAFWLSGFNVMLGLAHFKTGEMGSGAFLVLTGIALLAVGFTYG